MPELQSPKGQPGIAKVALFGLCPECGAKTLFAGPSHFSDRCSACGLDFSGFNVGDGPAALLALVIGALIIISALILDSAVRPPFWVHTVIWVPITVAMTVYALRLSKGALLSAEHYNRAHEAGRDDVI